MFAYRLWERLTPGSTVGGISCCCCCSGFWCCCLNASTAAKYMYSYCNCYCSVLLLGCNAAMAADVGSGCLNAAVATTATATTVYCTMLQWRHGYWCSQWLLKYCCCYYSVLLLKCRHVVPDGNLPIIQHLDFNQSRLGWVGGGTSQGHSGQACGQYYLDIGCARVIHNLDGLSRLQE
jgi:hypothetical protein